MYEKKIWKTGDVITANALNNIEDGIEAASSSSGTPQVDYTKIVHPLTVSVNVNKSTPKILNVPFNGFLLIVADKVTAGGTLYINVDGGVNIPMGLAHNPIGFAHLFPVNEGNQLEFTTDGNDYTYSISKTTCFIPYKTT